MVRRMPRTLLGHPSGGSWMVSPPHHHSWFPPRRRCLVPQAELLPGLGGESISGKSEGIEKMLGNSPE